MTDNAVEVFCVLILFVSLINASSLWGVTEEYENVAADKVSEVNSSIFKTVQKYHCHFTDIKDPELLVYGTTSWVFPSQTVNLTLSYPPADKDKRHFDDRYTITGFSVMLFVDNTNTQGFITSGGILQDSINLTFTCNDVTMLAYEFWVYGVTSGVVDALSGSKPPVILC